MIQLTESSSYRNTRTKPERLFIHGDGLQGFWVSEGHFCLPCLVRRQYGRWPPDQPGPWTSPYTAVVWVDIGRWSISVVAAIWEDTRVYSADQLVGLPNDILPNDGL